MMHHLSYSPQQNDHYFVPRSRFSLESSIITIVNRPHSDDLERLPITKQNLLQHTAEVANDRQQLMGIATADNASNSLLG